MKRDFRKVFSYNWRDTSQKMSRFSLTKKENWISFLCFVCTAIFSLLECWNYYRIEEQKVQNYFFEKAILDFFFKKKKMLHPLKSSQKFLGRNFDDYPGFQPFRSWANTYAQDCNLNHGHWGVVPCACIQVYHMQRLNTCTLHHCTGVHVWNRFSDSTNFFQIWIKFSNLKTVHVISNKFKRIFKR